MIHVARQGSGESGAQLTLRPRRALTAPQFVVVFALCSGLMWAVAAMGWWAGNVFAPVFALAHSALVGMALRAVWKSGEREEVISIAPELVEVRRCAQATAAFRAHPYWVRLQVRDGGEHITLSSSGRSVQVGALLGPAERQELATQLRALLAAALRP